MSYSWVPFYREVAGVVLGYENKQSELISLLKEMASQGQTVIGLNDFETSDKVVELGEIDLFTFFASWNRGGETNRRQICAFLKAKWGLKSAVPTDFDGIPLVNPQKSWFFDYKHSRKEDDLAVLWRVARAAYGEKPDAIGEGDFARALQVGSVGVAKLTMGLFWISPKGFLPLDKNTVARAKSVGVDIVNADLDTSKLTLTRYREILEQIHEKLGFDHLKIAHDSYGAKGNVAVEEAATLHDFPLNRILYGPPGTGKTFNAIPRAVEIITGQTFDNRADCQSRFDELRREGRIGFVTFHQSFSYEEFIEGLRPRLDDEADGSVKYEVRDGVLKELALRAIGISLEKSTPNHATFEQLWEAFLQEISKNPEKTYKGLTGNAEWQMEEQGEGLRARNLKGVDKFDYSPCRKSDLQRVWNEFSHQETISTAEVKAVLGRRRRLVASVFNQLKRVEKESGELLAPLPSESGKSPDAAKSLLRNFPDYRANFQKAPRYVLIIDEINRGNISKILGELITLLEDDKRLGQANELRVTLPVSLETFALPPNLYILGTMNTADKSLALLDIALRRRFEFEEIRPDFSLPDLKLSTEMRGVLETLNLRLEAALDREHCLGHAYFKDVETPEQFDAVFRAKIIPLLQEFFYNDWETLRAVLGETHSKGFVRPLKDLKGLKNRTKWRWWFDANPTETLDCLKTLTDNYAKLGEVEGDDDDDETNA